MPLTDPNQKQSQHRQCQIKHTNAASQHIRRRDKNVKKAILLLSKTTTLHVQHAFSRFKVMLQETIRNNDFYCNTALQ